MHELQAEALPKASGPNGRRALDYAYVTKDLVDASKDPSFTAADWGPLAALVATDRFVRVGSFMEQVDWQQYEQLLTMWGKATDWTFRVRRVTEGEDYAIVELVETAVYADRTEVYNSISAYEFDAAGRVVHLDVYIQTPRAPSAEQQPSWDLEAVDAQPA